MSKIALDIALLPPNEVLDICLNLSNKAFERGEIKFKKSKTERIPHISILMGCFNDTDLKNLFSEVKNISLNQKIIELEIVKNNTYSLQIKKTIEIENLQKKLINNLSKYFKQNCDFESLLENPDYIFDERSKVWVNTYIEDSTGKNFDPHITIHGQTSEELILPIKFTAKRLVVCHMGDIGTCRKILYETTLQS